MPLWAEPESPGESIACSPTPASFRRTAEPFWCGTPWDLKPGTAEGVPLSVNSSGHWGMAVIGFT